MSRMIEHQYHCEGPEEAPHPREDVVLMTRFGAAPEVPKCPACGRPMPKIFHPTAHTWNARWEHLYGE